MFRKILEFFGLVPIEDYERVEEELARKEVFIKHILKELEGQGNLVVASGDIFIKGVTLSKGRSIIICPGANRVSICDCRLDDDYEDCGIRVSGMNWNLE